MGNGVLFELRKKEFKNQAACLPEFRILLEMLQDMIMLLKKTIFA